MCVGGERERGERERKTKTDTGRDSDKILKLIWSRFGFLKCHGTISGEGLETY